MAETGNMHWTDDDELLSKFVLHQLPSSEESTLSSHLSSCEKCSLAVSEETVIAAGAKLAGREAMKERLRLHLSKREKWGAVSAMRNPTGYQIHWTQLAGVAAVVSIIIVLGVYNNWFGSNSWNKSTPQEEIAQEKGSSPSEPPERETQRSMPEDLRGKDLPQSSSSTELDHVNKPQVQRTELLKEKASGDKRVAHEESTTSVTAEPGRNAATGVAAVEAGRVGNELQMNDDGASPEPQTFWVEGYVIRDVPKKSQGTLSATPRDQVSDIMKHEAEAKKDVQQLSKTRNDVTMLAISLSQKPTTSLPPTLQYRQGQQGVVQALIENKDNAIQMTLYLDSPLADSELRSANIEVINNDSLILNLSSQRLGFRLPPALQNQANTKARQVR
jgi:hypothetical protein